jgi:hypothetical protein
MLGFDHRRLTNSNRKRKMNVRDKRQVTLRVMQEVALTYPYVNGMPVWVYL